MPKQHSKFVALNERLVDYLCECRTGANDKTLAALREETAKLGEISIMQIGPEQGSFMTVLVAAIGARNAIEIGTFTGYSSICIARGLPANGRLLCLDESAEWIDIARGFWKRAGVDKKITLILGNATENLKKLPRKRNFDFAFIDASKTEYDAYFELVLPRMRRNGVILFDNMLWRGRLGKKAPIRNPAGKAIDALNRKLSRDLRVESVLLSIGDGVLMC